MAIIVQDEIVVAAQDLPKIQALLEDHYRSGAEARGLTLASIEISPPVVTAQGPLTLYVRWQLPDVGAWWAMRAQSGCEAVYAYWEAVDKLCQTRCRTYLVTDAFDTLPAPVESRSQLRSVRYHRETAQLALREGCDPQSLSERLTPAAQKLPGLIQSALGQNLAPEYAAGHFTWDLVFPDAASARAAQDSAAWREGVAPVLDEYCEAVHAFALTPIEGGVTDKSISQGVKRTAFFRLLPGAPDVRATQFEQDLLEMPRHIPEIVNWRLSRAEATPWNRSEVTPWTYIWEQEFATLEGLTGPYMIHPHHWSHVDRWFDPESGDQIVDVAISHAFSFFDNALLAQELVPGGE